jgi:tRNA A-37 threonylcarbamoyl transferase component Bud32
MDFSAATVIVKRPDKTVYRMGDTVVKLMNPDYAPSDVLNEAHNHAIVSEIGLRVPALIEVVKIDGQWAIVTEYIEGKTIKDLLKEKPAQTDSHIERFVALQLEMQTHTATKLRHHFDKFNAKINETGLDATARYELHTRLNGLPRHNKLCHGDFTTGNVIITPGGEAYVLDWAHATQGNASADAARTYLRFVLAGDVAHAEKYMNLFCQKSDTARSYVNKWLAICAASQLVKKIPEERALLMQWANVVEYV